MLKLEKRGVGLPSAFLDESLGGKDVVWFANGLVSKFPKFGGLGITSYEAYQALIECDREGRKRGRVVLSRSIVNERSGPLMLQGRVPFWGIKESYPLQWRNLEAKLGEAHRKAGNYIGTHFQGKTEELYTAFAKVVEEYFSTRSEFDPAELAAKYVNVAFRVVLADGKLDEKLIDALTDLAKNVISTINMYAFMPSPLSNVLPRLHVSIQRQRKAVEIRVRKALEPYFDDKRDDLIGTFVREIYLIFLDQFGKKMAIEKALEYFYALFQAGLHTTVIPMTWGFCELAGNSELLAKIEDRDAVEGLSWKNLDQLKNLTYLVYQQLCLNGPLLMDPRIATEDFTLELSSGPVEVKEGTAVLVSTHWVGIDMWNKGIGTGDDYFELIKHHPAFMYPFAGFCLGKDLAVTELCLALMVVAKKLREYSRVTLVRKPEPKESFMQSTLGYNGGLIRVE